MPLSRNTLTITNGEAENSYPKCPHSNSSAGICFLDSSKDTHNKSYIQKIEFLESEVLKKNEKIEQLQSQYNCAFKDALRFEAEAKSIKSYVYSLPTHEEMNKLVKELSSKKKELQQINLVLKQEKATTSQLSLDITKLNQKVFDFESTLKSKDLEVEAMQYQINCWERRRKAAALAGELTVEDVLAEKSDLEMELNDFKSLASRREKNLMAALLKLKTEIIDHENKLGESRERENSLDIKISQLECELTASTKRVDQLQSTEQELNDQLRNLTEKLSELRTKDSDREKNNVEALRLVEEMCRSRVALERMIEFVQNALLAQFSDPALLFTVSKDDEGVRSIAETAVTTSDLTQLILQRSEEAKEMQAKLIRCQEKIMKIYADNLSSSISNQCNIQ